jgi:hypothetical protein
MAGLCALGHIGHLISAASSGPISAFQLRLDLLEIRCGNWLPGSDHFLSAAQAFIWATFLSKTWVRSGWFLLDSK